MRLHKIPAGKTCRVCRVETKDTALKYRLLEIGFVENTKLRVIRSAPVGKDPTELELRGFHIAMRKTELYAIEVQVLE